MIECVWKSPADPTAVLHYACGLESATIVTEGWSLVSEDSLPMHWECNGGKTWGWGWGGLIQTPPNNNEELFVWQHPEKLWWTLHWTCGTWSVNTTKTFVMRSKTEVNPFYAC